MKEGWIKTSDRLPEKSGYYLVTTSCGWRGVVRWSAKHQLFNVWDEFEEDQAQLRAITTVERWMVIPGWASIDSLREVDQSTASLLATWVLEVFKDE